jgi:hypothetical protein
MAGIVKDEVCWDVTQDKKFPLKNISVTNLQNKSALYLLMKLSDRNSSSVNDLGKIPSSLLCSCMIE